MCCPAFSTAALGPKQTLLSCLGSNPAVHVEWFWSCTFSFAVSSSYLQAEELADIRDVVAVMLAEFARYITGVGIPGEWAGHTLWWICCWWLLAVGGLLPSADSGHVCATSAFP